MRALIDKSNYTKRWVAYIDLLGFSNLVSTGNLAKIFAEYDLAIKRFIEKKDQFGQNDNHQVTLDCLWFSDTFIYYSKDDSAASSRAVEAVTRWFSNSLITSRIPLRGAISCGELYVDKENNMVFGKALLEAHCYGESQDWIGVVLCPSAEEQMLALGLPANERLDYAREKIVYKPDSPFKANLKNHLYCLLICRGLNLCLERLREMRNRAPNDSIRGKYDRTLDFIDRNKRTAVTD